MEKMREHDCGCFFRLVTVMCGVSAGVGVLSLGGWFFEVPWLTHGYANFIPMAPNTALLFSMQACALFSIVRGFSRRLILWSADVIVLLSLFLSGVTLLQNWPGFQLGIDSMLFRTSESIGTVPVGHMSPITASCFFLCGIALASLRLGFKTVAACFGIIVAITGYFNLIGYCYGAPLLYDGRVIPMAMLTAFCFIVLSTGLVFAAGPEIRPLRWVVGDATRARLLRALLPPVFILILIGDWIGDMLLGQANNELVIVSAFTSVFLLLAIGLVISIVSRSIGDDIDNAHKQVQEAREYLYITLQSIGDAVITANLDGSIAGMNPAAEQLTGWKSDQAKGKPFSAIFRIIDTHSREPVGDPVARVLETGEIVGLAHQASLIARDGKEYQITHRAAPIRDEEKRVKGVVLVFSDVTRENAATASLRQSEIKQSAMVANIADVIAIIDKDGRNSYQSPNIEKWFGRRPEEVVGHSVWDNIHPEDHEHTKKAFNLLLTEPNATSTGECRYRCKNGSFKWIEFTGVNLIHNPDIQGVLLNYHDITNRKNIEDLLNFITQRGWVKTGRPFLPALAERLGQILEVDYVVINKLDEDPGWAETVGLYAHGSIVPNLRYSLTGTPCENVFGKEMCLYGRGVRQLFPSDGLLVEMKADSYLGIPLWDASGRSIGLIAVIHSYPLENHGQAKALLKLVAASASAEIERQREELALRRERDRAQGYFDTVEAMLVALDSQGRIVRVNRKGCQLLGWTESELTGAFWFERCLPQPEGKEQVYRYFQKIMAGDIENLEYFENSITTRSGASLLIAWHNCLLHNDNGDIVGVLSAGEDITLRKQAELELLESRKQYRNLVEGTPDLVTRVDMEGRLLFVNHASQEIYGLTPQQCLGRPSFEFIHPEDRGATSEAFQKWLNSDSEVFSHENRQVSVDGRIHHVAWSVRAEWDENNNIIGFASSARDMTDRKRAEVEKAKLEAQFQQAQKMESVGRLAGGVAHDFNNMLQAILGNVDLVLESMHPNSALHDNLEQIRACARRSADLTRQLLAFARQQAIAPKILDLNECVESMLKMMHRLIGEDIELVWQPASKLGLVKLDPSQLDQIIANLCVNARDAIGGVGKITIETENVVFDEVYCADQPGFVPGEYVMLAVSDNGCGMDKDTIAHIFEPFFTTKGIGKGTGLGLAMIYGIVKQNNGFIHVYSEPNHGTTFKIYLPRKGKAAAAIRQEKSLNLPASSGEVILFVEDEPTILAIGQKILERLGYCVLAANTPGEAIQLFKTNRGKIHLLMTDVIMPEMNGQELAKRLIAETPSLKCLFMSGYTADVIAHHGVLDEHVFFIQKPFSMEDMAAKVRAILDSNDDEIKH